MSDIALRRVGLERNTLPQGEPGELVIPRDTELSTVQRSLAYRLPDFQGFLPNRDAAPLEPLVLDAGSRRFSDSALREGVPDRWPLLRSGEWIVLARPFAICTAVRHRLTLRAVAEVGGDAAAALFGSAVDADVADSLRRMSLSPELVRQRDSSIPFTELRARCDSDKIVVALVVSDDLVGVDERSPYTSFDTRSQLDAAHAHLETIARRAAADNDEVLGLIVGQGAGRRVFVGTTKEQASNLTLKGITAADLDVIAFLESGDPLALWKFARAPRVLERLTQMTMFSPLDGYGAYRDAERSFLPSRNVTSVLVQPGAGADYRREARAARDRHGQPDITGRVREVEREEPDHAREDHLCFAAELVYEQTIARFVARGPLGIWVTGPRGDLDLPIDLIDTVAYWLSQLEVPMAAVLRQIARTLPCLHFEVVVESGSAPDARASCASQVEVVSPGVARLTLRADIEELATANDNAADRLLAGLLVDGITELAAERGFATVVASLDRSAVVDLAAPLGLKKHYLAFAVDDRPMMEPADDRERSVQEADLTAARFAVAGHLRETFGYQSEHIPHDRRNEVLRSVVAFLFEEVRRVIGEVSPQGLLESLMADNERLLAASERRRTILAPREATYPESAEELRDEVARANQAAVCCRFLVEYAAAQPPSGEAHWSMARYDEALAAVSLLIDWGNLSDAIHAELTTMDLLVREDGQLRLVEFDRYETGRGAYFDVYVEEERKRSRRRFAPGSRTGDEHSMTATLRRLDPHVEAEAGVTLMELGELLVAANLVARDRQLQVIAIPRSDAIAALSELLEWPGDEEQRAARVSCGISYLSMGPRVDFLAPPHGKAPDTYPWLFARRWSYNRRPFAIRLSDAREEEVLWGRRHVVQAMQILVGQMTSGRYQALAETSGLRRELGRLADEDGAAFEREVAQTLRQVAALAIAERVRRLGGDLLERAPGQPLGDIDILVGDGGRRILWALECKDLSGALTAAEVAREMSEHFRSIGSTSMTRHAERVEWLETRIAAALDHLGFSAAAEGWSVRGLFVTSRPVHAPYIDDPAMEIVPLDELVAHIRNA